MIDYCTNKQFLILTPTGEEEMPSNSSSDRSWFHAYNIDAHNIALLILTFLGCWWVYKGVTNFRLGDDTLGAGCSLIAMVLVGLLINIAYLLQDIKEKLEKIKDP